MKILFVYNADKGLMNRLFDIGHKLIRPETYSCQLCSITHDLLREKNEWTQYRNLSNHELEFLHRDEFLKKYPANVGQTFPVILKTIEDNQIEVLISTEAINQISSIEELIQCLPK